MDPRRRQARPEYVERGRHAQKENNDALVREGHVPSSEDRHDRSFRQQGRNTAGNTAGWRVSTRSRRMCVDLASKIQGKTMKVRPEHTVDDTKVGLTPP
jgi:hypothetical protein